MIPTHRKEIRQEEGALPRRARSFRFRAGDDEYVILSAPLAHVPQFDALTAAEHVVLAAILDGQSNRAIARARGVALSTVINQVGAIYRKLGVQSRAEAMALCHGVLEP
jgi:DNA-binding NarL/FixJ family response regulator